MLVQSDNTDPEEAAGVVRRLLGEYGEVVQ